MVLALSLATGCRIGALALLDTADLDLDPTTIVGARDCGPTLTIRAEEGRKMNAKARREGADLVLPLNQLAVGLLREALALRADRGGTGSNLFQARFGQLVSADVTRAWLTLVQQGKAPGDATAHDLRRSMRSHLGELDHPGSWEDEERLLGHKVGNAVAHYHGSFPPAAGAKGKSPRIRTLPPCGGIKLAKVAEADRIPPAGEIDRQVRLGPAHFPTNFRRIPISASASAGVRRISP